MRGRARVRLPPPIRIAALGSPVPAWMRRDLSAFHYVHIWADGVYLQARLAENAECMLVIIGATAEDKKELQGFQVSPPVRPPEPCQAAQWFPPPHKGQ